MATIFIVAALAFVGWQLMSMHYTRVCMNFLRPIPTWAAAWPSFAFTAWPIWLQWQSSESWSAKTGDYWAEVARWKESAWFQDWTLWIYTRTADWLPWPQQFMSLEAFQSNLEAFVLRPYWQQAKNGGSAFLLVFVIVLVVRLFRTGLRLWRRQPRRYGIFRYYWSELLLYLVTVLVIMHGVLSGWLPTLQIFLENWVQAHLIASGDPNYQALGQVLKANLFMAFGVTSLAVYLVWNTLWSLRGHQRHHHHSHAPQE